MKNNFENQIDEIRTLLYEENKDLSCEDFILQMNARGRAVAERCGFTIVADADSANNQRESAV